MIAATAYCQGPPISCETPVMLGLEGNGIRTFGKFIKKEHSNVYIQPIGIPYNVTTKFQIGSIIPYKRVRLAEEVTNSGIADVTIFAKYQLFKKDMTAKTFRVLVKVKQTLPTGTQVSSNRYNTYFGLVIGRVASTIGTYGDVGFIYNSEQASDKIAYNFSLGIPLLKPQYPQKQINVFLEFNGNYLIDNKANTLFFSPGFQFIPGRRVLFETSFQKPIVEDESSLNKTKYRMIVGTRFLIN